MDKKPRRRSGGQGYFLMIIGLYVLSISYKLLKMYREGEAGVSMLGAFAISFAFAAVGIAMLVYGFMAARRAERDDDSPGKG